MARLTQVSAWLRPAWIDRNLALVLAARAAMSAARAVAGVVTALYLASQGYSALRIGMVFLGVALASAAMSTGIGLASDAVGRKPFLVAVPLLAAAAAMVFAVDRTGALLFLFAALGSFGRGAGAGAGNVGPYQPAEAAFVAEVVPAAERTAAFGRLSFVSSLGALAGGLLAGLAQPGRAVAQAATAAYRPAFLAAAVLAGIAGLLALGLTDAVGERHRRSAGQRRPRMVLPRRSWHMLWRFWVTNGLNGMAIGLFGPFVSYWFHRRYGASPQAVGALFAVINVATLASALAAPAVGRRLGTVRAIVAVRVLQGALLVPMALAPDFAAAGGIYLVRMLVQRVGLPLRQSFTQAVADPEERASLAALSNLPAQGTQAGSQVLAGFLFDQVSLAAPLLIGGVLQTLNAAAYAALFRGVSSADERAAAPAAATAPPEADEP
ncbi:MAG: MFS transporter, partial [Acidimicrobiales bacterium]